jgi:hypothetical protein
LHKVGEGWYGVFGSLVSSGWLSWTAFVCIHISLMDIFSEWLKLKSSNLSLWDKVLEGQGTFIV